MTDYSIFNRDKVMEALSHSYSVEEFMSESGIKSLDKQKPR